MSTPITNATINPRTSQEDLTRLLEVMSSAQQAALFGAVDKMRGVITPPFLLDTDTYKLGHPSMYPSDVTEMKAYFTCRGPMFEEDERIVFYGMRYLYETVLSRPIRQLDIIEADKYLAGHGVANTPMEWPKELWQKIVDGGGHIPLKVQALRDGSVVYPQVPCYVMTAKQGDLAGEEFQFLVTWLETRMMRVWSECCTATKSAMAYFFLKEKFEASVDKELMFLLESRLHDFGSRGTSSTETSMKTGLAHLAVFDGTDTMIAGWLATRFNEGKHIGTSVRATEHSVMTCHSTELGAVLQAIEGTPSGGILSVVADSYSYRNFLLNVLPVIAPIAQEKGILFVVRPDSGEPVECVLEGLELAAAAFGTTTNSKGFKVIDGAGVIQGDGINLSVLMNIADAVHEAGWSAQNVAYGMGGGLLQKQDRDTLKVATKLCAVRFGDGIVEGRMKKPSDDISKTSLPGPFQVNLVDGRPQIYPLQAHWEDYNSGIDCLEVIWNCGPVDYKFETIDEVRLRIRKDWSRSIAKNGNVLSNQMTARVADVAENLRDRYEVASAT